VLAAVMRQAGPETAEAPGTFNASRRGCVVRPQNIQRLSDLTVLGSFTLRSHCSLKRPMTVSGRCGATTQTCSTSHSNACANDIQPRIDDSTYPHYPIAL
jgi:hypothetical protein